MPLDIKEITPNQAELLHNEGWEFDILSTLQWAKNKDLETAIYGKNTIDFLIEESAELEAKSEGHGYNPVIRTKQCLDKKEIVIIQLEPLIIQHKNGKLSTGFAADWLLKQAISNFYEI